MPDLNYLPSSSNSLDTSSPTLRNGEGTPSSSSPSPRSASVSLQAAATLNAGLRGASSVSRHRQSPSASRRRSQVMMNVQHAADPSVPGPGEIMADASPRVFPTSPSTADPHHSRTPSMGELHQTLESENEFHVNRLLQEIRLLQAQLAQRPNNQGSGDDSSDRSAHAGPVWSPAAPPRSSFDMARADLQRRSRTPSRGASPRLRSTSFSAETGEPWTLAGRDESAFYQAETHMLKRENRMLRHRIRELERQLTDHTTPAHEPSQPSHLGRSTSEDEARNAAQPSAPPPMPTVSDEPKEQ